MYFWEERGKMSMNRILVAFCCASLNCLWQNVSRQKKCPLAHLHMGASSLDTIEEFFSNKNQTLG